MCTPDTPLCKPKLVGTHTFWLQRQSNEHIVQIYQANKVSKPFSVIANTFSSLRSLAACRQEAPAALSIAFMSSWNISGYGKMESVLSM